MKILHKICFVLLFATFSSAYARDCWDAKFSDIVIYSIKKAIL